MSKARGQLCSTHYAGVAPGSPLTFDPACVKCQELRAAGKRTGLEPMPRSRMRGPNVQREFRAWVDEAITERDGAAAARKHRRGGRR